MGRWSVALELENWHFEIVVETNYSSRSKAEAEEVGQWVPIPVLGEQGQTDDGWDIGVSSNRLWSDSAIAPTAVDYSRGQACTKLGHDILVFIANLLGEELPHLTLRVRNLSLKQLRVLGSCLLSSGLLSLGGLYKDHGQGDECTLPNEIDRIICHWLQKIHSSLDRTPREVLVTASRNQSRYLEPSPCA